MQPIPIEKKGLSHCIGDGRLHLFEAGFEEEGETARCTFQHDGPYSKKYDEDQKKHRHQNLR